MTLAFCFSKLLSRFLMDARRWWWMEGGEGGREKGRRGEQERLQPRRKSGLSADGLVITHWKPISLNIAS